MLSEFKEFIAKGNVMDLAVGVIIGAAFQRIVDSLVNDMVMPVVGLAHGRHRFHEHVHGAPRRREGRGPYASLAEAKAAGATVSPTARSSRRVIQFLILAWVVFLMVKAVNRIRRQRRQLEVADVMTAVPRIQL
jgi:large conductance mechanosensitive channel